MARIAINDFGLDSPQGRWSEPCGAEDRELVLGARRLQLLPARAIPASLAQ